MKKLLPVILALVGLAGGAAAGWMLKPAPPPEPEVCLDAAGAPVPPEQAAEVCPPKAAMKAEDDGEPTAPPEDPAHMSEFVPLERQFVVPVMKDGRIAAMMVVGLSIEVGPGQVEAVLGREPRMRDALLRALFEHAYSGGFDGDFTAEYVMRDLRRGLLRAARRVSGPEVRDVLVEEIIRQDQ